MQNTYFLAKICLILIFLLVPFYAVLHAVEALKVTTNLEPTTLTTGDFLLYEVQVIHPYGVELEPFDLRTYLKGLDVDTLKPQSEPVLEKDSWFSTLWPFEQKKPALEKTHWAWHIWPNQPGSWTIPAIKITSIPNPEQSSTLWEGITQAKSFTVRPLFQADPNNPETLPLLKVNQEPLPKLTLFNWVWVALAIGILLILAGIGWYYHKKASNTPPVPAELDHERALRRLQELEQLLSTHPEAIHQYYYLLSEIFREYLERRFGFSATTMTTQEFLPLLKQKTSYTLEEQQQIALLTQRSDLIKYAEVQPTSEERKIAYREVVKWIEKVALLPAEAQENSTPATPMTLQETP